VFVWLNSTAIESPGRVTWIDPAADGGGLVRTLGPTLYGGLAGLALALSHYYAAAGYERALNLAVSSIRQALDTLPQIPTAQSAGLYGGVTGVVYVACHIAKLAGDASLLDSARVAASSIPDVRVSTENDVMSGLAGAVAGLSLMASVLGEAAIARANRIAQLLKSTASPRRGGAVAVWPPPRRFGRLPLTGFSHGAAGIAWALLELWQVTHQEWVRELAEAAFAYEDGTFDPERVSWPDFRYYRSSSVARRLPPPSQSFWCHGAAGIALARARASVITRQPAHRSVADIAATALVEAIGSRQGAHEASLSLCHGLAGNADILLSCADLLNRADLLDAHRRAVDRLRALMAAIDPDRGHASPGLMVGLTGEAVALLRSCRPDLISPLLLPPL
jgi:lantibiotic biosynthesis protein